jgi:hypothetical protein
VTVSENVAGDEPYLLVEEVAERLGLPLSVLLHRVEAGDIPSRRIEADDGVHYALRIGDLGIELDEEAVRAAAIDGDESTMSASFEPPSTDQVDGGRVFEPGDSDGVESAIASAFNSGPLQVPGEPPAIAGEIVGEEAPDGAPEAAAEQPAAPMWSVRPREPAQPPPWIIQNPAVGDESASEDQEDDEDEVEEAAEPTPAAAVEDVDEDEDDDDRYLPPRSGAGTADDQDDGIPALVHAGDAPQVEEFDEETAVAELAVPPPERASVGLLDTASQSPRGDLASMSLDARELVAGLLDRWERSLEQRIYTEQRQRFQAELVARQNMVKQLQMELHSARAEHAAAQAEKDRMLATKERELADRERDLADTRRQAGEAARNVPPVRRRRWFRSRDD